MKQGSKISRRAMLGTAASLSVAVPAAAVAEPSGSSGKKPAASALAPLQTRKLGRNGPSISILSMGGQAELLSPDYYDKAWDVGIRYFDVADCYRGGQSERELGKWNLKYPERRKEVFICTKDHPKTLSDIPRMIDARLEALRTDHIDLFLIHGLGAKEYGEESYDWPKSAEFKRISERMKKTGKVNLLGFSCHDLQSDRYLHAAAEGGFVDAVLMHSFPFHEDGDGPDRAIDACHKTGIGLMGMKVMRNAARIPKRVPEFDKIGLTTHQAALHAFWSDERFSSACVWMANEGQLAENAEGARKYETPLLAGHRRAIRDLMLANGPALCPGCPSCREVAERYGTDLKSISRYVAYYEQDGTLAARTHYRALSMLERDASRIDLHALRQRCDFHVDYADIVQRAERYFA